MTESSENHQTCSHPQESIKARIEKTYWSFRLIEKKEPASVFDLCERAGIEEADFYPHYPSVDAIESRFWTTTVEETLTVLTQDADFAEYDYQQKLLAFFYTFIAHIQPNRSRFVACFPKFGLENRKKTKGMRDAFCSFAAEIVQQGIVEETIAARIKINDYYPQALSLQFGMLIQFYIEDESDSFQDTDAFIEKTVLLAAQTMRSGVVDSMFDIGRFLLRNTPLVK